MRFKITTRKVGTPPIETIVDDIKLVENFLDTIDNRVWHIIIQPLGAHNSETGFTWIASRGFRRERFEVSAILNYTGGVVYDLYAEPSDFYRIFERFMREFNARPIVPNLVVNQRSRRCGVSGCVISGGKRKSRRKQTRRRH